MRRQRGNLHEGGRYVRPAHGVAVRAAHRGVVQVLVAVSVRAGFSLGERDRPDVDQGSAPVIERRASRDAGSRTAVVEHLRAPHRHDDRVVHRLGVHLRRERVGRGVECGGVG